MSKKNQNQNKPSDENQVENPETEKIEVQEPKEESLLEGLVKEPTGEPDAETEKIEVQEEVVSPTDSAKEPKADSVDKTKEEPVIEFKEKIILPSEKQYYLDRLQENKKIIKSLRAELAASKKKIKDLESRAV